MKPKILLFDIETSPNLAFVWGKYQQDVIEFKEEWYLLSFCAKWLDGETIVKGLIDYPSYKKEPANDRELVTDLWKLFNEADIIIGHNGDKFDIRKSNTRFIEHWLTTPEPYKTIDTLKVAKKYFSFNSNRLDDLGRRLGVGRKVKTGGFELWLGCINGDSKAWDLMKKYNKQDVLLLERIYLKLRPWIQNHPNVAIISSREEACPACRSFNLQRRGFGFTKSGKFPRYQCMDCGKWSQGSTKQVTDIR